MFETNGINYSYQRLNRPFKLLAIQQQLEENREAIAELEAGDSRLKIDEIAKLEENSKRQNQRTYELLEVTIPAEIYSSLPPQVLFPMLICLEQYKEQCVIYELSTINN